MLSACTQVGPAATSGAPSKAEAAALMTKADAPDYCEWFGWYGDGICDTFCANPDPDCAPAEEECFRSGCGGEICAAESVISTCEVKPESICLEGAICETQASGSCGFTLSAEAEECLDEVQAGEPVYLSIAPTQCGTNPWEMNPVDTQGFEHLGAELALVAAYYQSLGIVIDQVGFADSVQPKFVCLACSCPRGDRLVVKAGAFMAQRLKQEGFATLKGAVGTAPVQCGGNPWQQGAQSAPEMQLVSDWAGDLGAPLAEVGFLDSVAPMVVCAACQCSRGDFLVALPEADVDVTLLSPTLGAL